jgi:hypothetical protein
MILRRAQIEFDAEAQLVEEMIDALAGSGLPWLSEHEHMDVEPGINDFDATELEWLRSLTRNAKSVLASTITSRFTTAKAWEVPGYARQLQIVIRILSVIQEFRRLYDILMLAILNNSQQDTLSILIAAVVTWHPPLEGMGVLPSVIDALAANVLPMISQLTSVGKHFSRNETKYTYPYSFCTFAYSSRVLKSDPCAIDRRIHSITSIYASRVCFWSICVAALRPWS